MVSIASWAAIKCWGILSYFWTKHKPTIWRYTGGSVALNKTCSDSGLWLQRKASWSIDRSKLLAKRMWSRWIFSLLVNSSWTPDFNPIFQACIFKLPFFIQAAYFSPKLLSPVFWRCPPKGLIAQCGGKEPFHIKGFTDGPRKSYLGCQGNS